MAKVTITLEDTIDAETNETTLTTHIEFDPPLEKGMPVTMAQQMGRGIVGAFCEAKKEEDEEDGQ